MTNDVSDNDNCFFILLSECDCYVIGLHMMRTKVARNGNRLSAVGMF